MRNLERFSKSAIFYLVAIATLSATPAIAHAPIEGIWGVEEYNCGGPTCEKFDIRNGTARLTLDALRIRVQGSKICGIRYGYSSKLYRFFVVGTAAYNAGNVVYGQEIDHHPEFDVQNFKDVPVFSPDEQGYARLHLFRGKLLMQSYKGTKTYPVAVLHRLSKKQEVYWGLEKSQQWEPEFEATCLGGSDVDIEKARAVLHAPAATSAIR